MSDGLHLARIPTENNKRLLARPRRGRAAGWWRVGGEIVQPTLCLPTCSALPCSALPCSVCPCAVCPHSIRLRSLRARLQLSCSFCHALFGHAWLWSHFRLVTLGWSSPLSVCPYSVCAFMLCSVTLAAGTAAAFRLVRSGCDPRSLAPVGSGK